MENVCEEEVPEYEITAIDHINKQMLENFKEYLDSKGEPGEGEKEEENDTEWND